MAFEQTAKALWQLLPNSEDEQEQVIREFLVKFAEHVLWQTTPASGSTILKFQGLHIKEMVEKLPEMREY